MRTEGQRKCSLQQSGRHGVVNCHVLSWNRTPTVGGAMGPHSLCTQNVVCVSTLQQLYGVHGQASCGSCIEKGVRKLYKSAKGSSKMSFVAEWLTWGIHSG